MVSLVHALPNIFSMVRTYLFRENMFWESNVGPNRMGVRVQLIPMFDNFWFVLYTGWPTFERSMKKKTLAAKIWNAKPHRKRN